jgi:uncharacterized membrane protein YfcA
MRQRPEEGVVNRSTVVVVLAIFLLGVLAGVALAKWLVSAVAAIGVAVVVVVIALIAYYVIRRQEGAAAASRRTTGAGVRPSPKAAVDESLLPRRLHRGVGADRR